MGTTVVIGAQWGDEGKGKIVDLLAADADFTVRFQGGNNAGHTVVVDGAQYILHLVPSGVLSARSTNVIGNGVVVDPLILGEEIQGLRAKGFLADPRRLLLSDRAHLIMPYHRRMDAARERHRGKGKIGTTGRGIGPAYEDKAARMGIRAGDLLHEKVFRDKVAKALYEKNHLLKHLYGEEPVSAAEVEDAYLPLGECLRDHIDDTSLVVNEAIDGGRVVLFEGAQGVLLDIDHGTFPYVTSSNCVAGAAATGTGFAPQKIDRVLGIAKAYTTRVGSGPFPTELIGAIGDRLQTEGKEFGATTGRPRRCGWLDLLVLKHSVRVSGLTSLALTKLDVLSTFDSIPICTGYRWRGEVLTEFPENLEVLEGAQPIYEEMHGWSRPLDGVQRFEDLPDATRAYVETIEGALGVSVDMISIGPDRKETIIRRHPLS